MQVDTFLTHKDMMNNYLLVVSYTVFVKYVYLDWTLFSDVLVDLVDFLTI